jgi:hypothetical protein
MKRIKLWATCAVCLPAAMAIADQATYQVGDFFRANEGSLDLFGSASLGQYTLEHLSGDRIKDNGRLGWGLGGNYFFTKNIGIGGDAYSENTGHSFFDSASGNVIIRFPFEGAHVAPYIFGGGGYQFDPAGISFGQAGAGVDIRFTPHVGMFVDGRYEFLSKNAPDIGLFRLGVRFAF